VRRDLDRRADAVVLLLGGAGVDHDLARAGGPAALVEPERGRGGGGLLARVEADPEVGAVAGRLAVAGDDLRLVVDVADGGGDLRDGAHALEQRGVDRRALGGVVRRVDRERGLPGDDGVRAVVRGLGEAVRAAAHGVGQRERTAHHRDAEHDGQRGQDRAHGARDQSLEGDGPHRT
jgi:hypothetical protein